MKNTILLVFTIVIFLLLGIVELKADKQSNSEHDTLVAYKAAIVPEIDGDMKDACWQDVPWYSMNHVWMQWDTETDSSDYYGRFKLLWSEETNRMYIFAEITDDVLVERFSEFGNTAHYNDVIEVFIDEDNSGGPHVFDGNDDNWGTNAENAFSYHIAPLQQPEDGDIVKEISVIDLDGTGWGDSSNPDYKSHFPGFALRKAGDLHYWEFSMIVYTDEYEMDNDNNTEAKLSADKKMGLALAYCETDLTDEYMREMFYGSYPGLSSKLTKADGDNSYGYNDAWRNADDYNLCILSGLEKPENTTNIRDIKSSNPYLFLSDLKIYTDKQNLQLSFKNEFFEPVEISLYTISGQKCFNSVYVKRYSDFIESINVTNINPGIYIVEISQGANKKTKKITISE